MSTSNVVEKRPKSKYQVKKGFHPRGIAIPFYPELAEIIGVNDALLLVQIDYWLRNHLHLVQMINGERWLNLGAEGIRSKGFVHLSRQNINRTIDRLEKRGLLKVSCPPGKGRTKWLAINYECLQAMGFEVDSLVLDEANGNETGDEIQLDPVQEQSANHAIQSANHAIQGMNHATQSANHAIDNIYKESKDIKEPNAEQAKRGEDRARADAAEPDTVPDTPRKADPPPLEVVIPQLGKVVLEAPPEEETNSQELIEMEEALASACKMDLALSWHEFQIRTYALMLIKAGYSAQDVDNHAQWWSQNDWRGRKGDIPRPREVADTLRQSLPSGIDGRFFSPTDKKAAWLKRQAIPDCPHCSGDGWITKWDPRVPWEVCSCIGGDNSD